MTAWKHESTDDLYVELTPGSMLHEALAYSRRVRLPPVATNRVQIIRAESVALHRLLRAIALNTRLRKPLHHRRRNGTTCALSTMPFAQGSGDT